MKIVATVLELLSRILESGVTCRMPGCRLKFIQFDIDIPCDHFEMRLSYLSRLVPK